MSRQPVKSLNAVVSYNRMAQPRVNKAWRSLRNVVCSEITRAKEEENRPLTRLVRRDGGGRRDVGRLHANKRQRGVGKGASQSNFYYWFSCALLDGKG